jgi:hypothetical protein
MDLAALWASGITLVNGVKQNLEHALVLMLNAFLT